MDIKGFKIPDVLTDDVKRTYGYSDSIETEQGTIPNPVKVEDHVWQRLNTFLIGEIKTSAKAFEEKKAETVIADKFRDIDLTPTATAAEAGDAEAIK